MKEKFDLVVVGGGTAGITLAKRLGNKLKMAIIRPEDFSMVYCAMPYVIENLIDKQTSKIIGGQVYSGEPVTGLIDLISFAIQKKIYGLRFTGFKLLCTTLSIIFSGREYCSYGSRTNY